MDINKHKDKEQRALQGVITKKGQGNKHAEEEGGPARNLLLVRMET